MCGIAGLFSQPLIERPALERIVVEMTASIRRRGPDDSGVWLSQCGRVAFGHRRLSIVDLSPLGRQPKASADGRYTITFNGEIYNYQGLRQELLQRGHRFSGSSDTEVLLAAIMEWGFHDAIVRCTGMFALAVWDAQRETLLLARDRLGEKPLYLRHDSRGLLFGSSLRTVVIGSSDSLHVDQRSLALYLKYGYVPEPSSILDGTRRLPPATIEEWTRRPDGILQLGASTRYWHPPARGALFQGSRSQAVDALDDLLRDTVSGQMVADVPVGCLLSGGIDSTAVASVMQSLASGRILTFSVAFDDPAYNEAPHAAAVSRHLGTDHTEIAVTRGDLMTLIAEIPDAFDEPFADSSQLPMMAVARRTRQSVKVALSGDGGDELFGGYNRYYWTADIQRKFRHVPASVRRVLASIANAGSHRLPTSALRALQLATLGNGPVQNIRGKLQKAARQLAIPDLSAAYIEMMSLYPTDFPSLGVGADDDEVHLRRLIQDLPALDAFTLWDTSHYLPNDNLVKVDRASMAVGLEVRSPLLDHRICELARSLLATFEYKEFRKSPKWPLRELVYRRVPRELVDRPKMGFSVPIDHWLRNELSTWVTDQLDGDGARFFPEPIAGAVTKARQQHSAGNADTTGFLWSALMFIQWARSMPRHVSVAQPTIDALVT